MKEIHVTGEYQEHRVDKFCEKLLKEAPKSFLYKMFRKKNILLNRKKIQGTERLKEGDVLSFYFSEETFMKFSGSQKTLPKSFEKVGLDKKRILYEDNYLLLYNKPANVLSQPDGKGDNLIHQYEIYKGKVFSSLERYGVCNRLDRNTTGLVIIGKDALTLRLINEAIRKRELQKHYYALIRGILTEKKHIKGHLSKDIKSNKVILSSEEDAFVHTEILETEPFYKSNMTLVKLGLHTGKTHQLRAHLASIGHPILGDPKYGNLNLNKTIKKEHGIFHQLLHSYSIRFPKLQSPLEAICQKTFYAPYPSAMEDLITQLRLKETESYEYQR